MKILKLDAKTLHSAFITACEAIIIHRENLNAINLFPVADGDTGDNMSATAQAVINHSVIKSTVGETFQSLANSALLGARGNSGMIFSQFFNGLTETPLTHDYIDTVTFAQLVNKASKSVRSAILNPVEGTIITVIDAWSASISKLAHELTCFKELTKQTLVEAQLALQSTENTIPVLKNAHTVDAGALGFFHFISGFADYLMNPRESSKKMHSELECDIPHHELASDGIPPDPRYCTEVTLEGENIDRVALAKDLKPFGESIVSSGNADLCRFHVHCNQPEKVFESFFDKGVIKQAKVEDMLRQFQMIHQRKHSIALVTDSSADIPQQILDDHQVHIISLNMHLDGHHLLDRICVNEENFYHNLTTLSSYPKTSFPSPMLMSYQLSHLAIHYDQVLVLPIAKALSGTHDALVKAAERFTNVHVLDTCQTSGGLGLLVTRAAQLIAAGLSIEQIKQELLSKIPKLKMYIYVEQFESLIRSGRVSKLSGRIAQLAHIKPVLSFNELGKGIVCDKAFSENKALIKLINLATNLLQEEKLETYGLVHTAAPEKALQFSKLTCEAFGQKPAFIESASTAVGLHAGKGSLGLALMLK